MRPFIDRLIARLIAGVRSQQLARQRRSIETRIRTLSRSACTRLSVMTLREIGLAAKSPQPHLYGTPAEERHLPWGRGTTIGYARACSDNPELALRGIALWLAAAYHETKVAAAASLQAEHRHLLRLVRELKALQTSAPTGPRETIRSWMQPSVVA